MKITKEGKKYRSGQEMNRSYFNKFKSTWSDEVYFWVLRELAGEITKPLAIIFEGSWKSGEGKKDGRKRGQEL